MRATQAERRMGWFALRVLSKGAPQENIVNILKWFMNIGCHQFLTVESINLGAALNQPFYVQLKEKMLFLKWRIWMFQSGGRGRVLPLSFSCMHQTNFSLKFFSYFFVFPRVRFCLLSLGNCGRCQCIMFLQCLHKCCCSCAVCSVNTAWCLKYLFGFFL